MNKKYTDLFESITLNCGAVLEDRFVMAPMVVNGALPDGSPSNEDIAYFERRNKVGGMLITGATTVSELGAGFKQPLILSDDSHIEGFRKLAQAMKANGSKAIIQLTHNGREANIAYEKLGRVVAPSDIKFPFLPYTPEALRAEEIEKIIGEFGEATRRAIEAGFDGVEIHGANHYLLQQFFSSYSNVRDDYWGGTQALRMQFPLDILVEVKRVVEEYAPENFIVGYRISPEEVHGSIIGYTIDDSLELIEEIVEEGVDYLHISLFGDKDADIIGYKRVAKVGMKTSPMNKIIKDKVAGRTALIVVGNIDSAESALDALNYGDLFAMGEIALFDPDMRSKIKEGKEEAVTADVAKKEIASLALTKDIEEEYFG